MIRAMWQTVKKNKVISLFAAILLLIIVLSVVGPFLSVYSYSDQNLSEALLPLFSEGHLLGTDQFGADFFIRILYGIRISLKIGICAAVLQAVIGVVYGGIAGSAGGVIDEIMMRFVDIIYSIPYLIIVILLSVVMGSGEWTLILALAISDWTGMAKIVRVKTLQIKSMEFIQSAKVLGASRIRILLKHIIPNCTGVIIVTMMFSIPAAIFSEAFLSYIGLGVRIPKASLGSLASDGCKFMESNPQLFFIPVAVITLIILSFNILGDAVKDKLDSGNR